MNIDWEFILFILKSVFPLAVYIFLIYSFKKSLYPKIHWSIIGILSITYIVIGSWYDNLLGFISAIGIILIIALLCWGLSKLSGMWGKILKGIFITIGAIQILFISFMSAFMDGTNSETIEILSELENNKYNVTASYYSGNGAMPPGSRTIVTYVDKNSFFNREKGFFRVWSGKNIDLKFISNDSLLVKVNSDSLKFDLSQDLDLLDYRQYRTDKHRNKNPERLTEKIINKIENSRYKIILKRFKAERWQAMGEWKILYIDKVEDQDQEKVLWRVNRGDYADFDFLDETTLQIRTYGRQELDSLHIKKHYRDTVVVNLMYPDSTDFPFGLNFQK